MFDISSSPFTAVFATIFFLASNEMAGYSEVVGSPDANDRLI